MARVETFLGGAEPPHPWANRLRITPLRSYSGVTVIKRKKHLMTMSDLARLSDKLIVMPPERADNTWIDKLIQAFQKATIKMLEKLLPFLSPETVSSLYYTVYEILGKVFGVDTRGYGDIDGESYALLSNILSDVANRMNVDIVVTPRRR